MKLVLLLILTFTFASCVPQGGVSGRSVSNSQATPATDDNTAQDPDFSSSYNFLQYGQTQITSTLNLQKDYTDTLYLRGPQVHQYVDGHRSEINCLIMFFPTITALQGNSIVTVAARPNSFFNLQTGLREYYYMLAPSDSTLNMTYCNKPELSNQMAQDYLGKTSTTTIASVATLDSNALSSNAPSDPLRLLNQFGQTISGISLTNLNISLSHETQSQIPIGISCTTSVECTQAGYDCCAVGQCIRDKEVKTGVDQSSAEFLQALQDIELNPSNIRNYPHFFNFCPIDITPQPTPEPTPDPADNPDVRLSEVKDLYDCTTPFAGEVSICTKTIHNITNDNLSNYLPLSTDPYDLTYSKFYSGDSSEYDTANGVSDAILKNSIYQVIYGDRIIYDVTNPNAANSITFINPNLVDSDDSTNFNFTDSSYFKLPTTLNGSGVETEVLPTSGTDTTLRIRYTTDGSCEYVSEFLVKCYKTYIQGSNLGVPTDHFPGTNNFKLPEYADLTKYIFVTVDNIQKVQGSEWTLSTSEKAVSFTTPVEDSETVKLTFYVNTDATHYPGVFLAKKAAIEAIESRCNCVGPGCTLKPSYDENGSLTDYVCHYPPVDTIDPPMQTEVQVSSKAVPQRFFNSLGEEITTVSTNSGQQEGKKFEYVDNDKLKPNNLNAVVGFNEIYGNISYTVDSAAAPTIVNVKQGRSYDIFTENGSFSTCSTCGSDYYSQLIKLFPDNFLYRGGGYYPDPSETSRLNSSSYRSDDLLFGRACFLPATMIPWTHRPINDYAPGSQRLARQAAQHFLFANGYQRDWYGFDYGAIIGSFDGVAWFAIGNQRRIRATTNKLYIAINAYFGDLTQSNSFKVSITDTSLSYGGGVDISTDYENDGAQCQKYHACESDSDCAAQLGWEYTCQSVTQLQTQWPRFDENGKELINVSDEKRLVDILVGGFSGPAKRCVYRSRGVPCSKNYNSVVDTNSYAKTSVPGVNACLNNNYCQDFSTGSDNAKFNNKIARFARSPSYQNTSSELMIEQADTFGLEARVLGRPFDFNGKETVPSDARGGFNYNHVTSICIPGKNPEQTNFITSHQTMPTQADYSGDRISGIGTTPTSQQKTDNSFYGHCSVLDDDGNYAFLSKPTVLTSDLEMSALAASQSLSSKALEIFETIDPSLQLLADFKQTTVSEQRIDTNSCLRAPGSVCHTDMDCGPSPFVTQKLANIDSASDTGLNSAEKKFWKETLVCSQEALPSSADYALSKNRCCRESGNDLTIPTSQNTGAHISQQIPGYQIALNNIERLSRFMMLAKKRYDDSNKTTITTSKNYPVLRSSPANACSGVCTDPSILENQFNTLNSVVTNTCCSKNWIRNFDKEKNNGGHKWSPLRLQSFNYEGLKYLNWNPIDLVTDVDATGNLYQFSCNPEEAPDFINCKARNISLTEAEKYFKFFGTLELLGVPQIAVKTTSYEGARSIVDSDQAASSTTPIPFTIIKNDPTVAAQEDNYEYNTTPSTPATGEYSYSSTDMDNFVTTLKKVFSEDDLSCCQPTGVQMPNDAVPDDCCTGNLVNGRCCLPDYTDVSVYTNRYISSAAKGLNESQFDEETGYIKDTNIVEQVAYQEAICCSGSVTRGVSLNILKVKGLEDQNYTVRRFFDGTTPNEKTSQTVKKFWDAGPKWNNHVYCAPGS